MVLMISNVVRDVWPSQTLKQLQRPYITVYYEDMHDDPQEVVGGEAAILSHMSHRYHTDTQTQADMSCTQIDTSHR